MNRKKDNKDYQTIFKLYFVLLLLSFYQWSVASEKEYDPVFFDNSPTEGTYFYSKAGYQAPSYLQHSRNRLFVSSEQSFTPGNALKLAYVSADKGNWEASVVYPDWRGKDFIKPGQYLDFRIYIESKETSVSELPAIAIAKWTPEDTVKSTFIPLDRYIKNFKTGVWIPVHIPLSDFKNIHTTPSQDIKQVFFKQASSSKKLHTLYLDQIELSSGASTEAMPAIPKLIQAKAYERHVDLTWNPITNPSVKYIKIYRAEQGQDFIPVGIQDPSRGRYSDYTGQTGTSYRYKITVLDYQYNEFPGTEILTAQTYPMTDEQLLDMIQEASFRYYWDGAESNSGLALENIPGRTSMIAAGASGFGIMAIIAGAERGFITREQAVERLTKIVKYLQNADRFHGAYAHFMDGETGNVVPFFGKRDNGADLVETAFLFQGLLTACQYFSKNTNDEKFIREGITTLWKDIEWDWFKKTKDSKYLYWHWSPDQEWVINHPLIGWNETMITYLLAIASPTHGVDKSMYYTGWASQDQMAKDYRSNWGQTTDGSSYSNGNTYFGIKLDVGVSNGGPLFFIHYSYMGFNPHRIKDKYTETDYFNTFRNMALINYRYCVENPKKQQGYGSNCWGLTASDDPWNYRAAEPTEHQDWGSLAPTGALASFPYTPDQSMAALKNYYRNYGRFLWGEYGFKDAFNLNENWCANIYMGLNQAPVTVMIENYRTGLIWDLFMSHPDIRKMVDELFEK